MQFYVFDISIPVVVEKYFITNFSPEELFIPEEEVAFIYVKSQRESATSSWINVSFVQNKLQRIIHDKNIIFLCLT